ncbi:MAG: HIT family protein [Parcubacteria group bacterium]
MNDCLFCKIINGEIPAHKVYEDDDVLAFLDIMPVNPGHTLIVPKKHFANLLDADEKTLGRIISAVPKVARLIMTALDYQAFNLSVNNGKDANQIVSHLHFHVIPRRAGDGHEWFHGIPASAEELKAISRRLISII